MLVELEHQFKYVDEAAGVSISQAVETFGDQFLSVVLLALLVEACYIFHGRQLVKQEADTEDV